jgi:hypothetical protein
MADESRAVVFVSDRTGPALRRRERCLDLAGIAYSLESERRPSGTYFKLCVADRDAVNAYLAIGVGGCKRQPRLHEHLVPGLTESLSDVAGMLRDEAAIAAGKLVETVRGVAPQLLPGLRETDPRLRLGSEPDASLRRSVHPAKAVPRPAKPARHT